MRKKTALILFFGLLIISGIGWWGSKKFLANPPPAFAMPPPEVEFVTISPRSVTLSKTLPGRTSAYRVAEIRPQVNGIIKKRFFIEGGEVKAGDQLYQIDSASYQAAYRSAEADLLKAEANVKSVQAKSDRYAELVKIGGISLQEYDDVMASLAQSQANVAIAQAALATVKINLDYTKVLAPISGRIGKSLISEGALVTANQATPLAIIQQLDPLYVDVIQSSSDLIKLRRNLAKGSKNPKQKIQLLLEGDNEVYQKTGELQFSDISVDASTGTVQLRILFPNPDYEILPGLFVRTRIDQTEDKLAILVPQCAVNRQVGNKISVCLITPENKIATQSIKISDVVGDHWLVTEGLQAGDRVVVAGLQKIAPDVSVNPTERLPAR